MKSNKNLKIAKRYSESLIELSKENKISFDDAKVALLNTKEILNSSCELYSVLTNPIISANDKNGIIDEIFNKDVNETIRNFLKLLIEKNRFSAIYDIFEVYFDALDKINNIANVSVTCALELSEEDKKQIQEKLKEKLKKEIKIDYETDKSIIAGLVFKIGDDVIDTSLAHKLEEFKKEIIK